MPFQIDQPSIRFLAGSHHLRVMDELRNAALGAGSLSDRLKAQQAAYFMRYGAARRLLMMWHSYRNVVVYTAPPDRVRPLSDEESLDLTRDLNVIYINIRGVLDNFAWSLLYEVAPEKARNQNFPNLDCSTVAYPPSLVLRSWLKLSERMNRGISA